MSSQQWWVRIGQSITGPISASNLRALAIHRKIDPNTLVSQDKVRWVRARSLRGLFEPADEQTNSKTPLHVVANSDDIQSRKAIASSDREEKKEDTESYVQEHPGEDEVTLRYPILRTRSFFFWNDTIAIYDSRLLKGRRYWRRLEFTEEMCQVTGEAELRAQFHRECCIEFSDVLEVREKTFLDKKGRSQFIVQSQDHRQIKFTQPLQQAGDPRIALALNLTDCYWIRATRRREGSPLGRSLWSAMLVFGISIGIMGFSCLLLAVLLGVLLKSNTGLWGLLGVAGTGLGVFCGALSWNRLVSRGEWTKITKFALGDLESAQQPKRSAPVRRTPIRSKPLGWTLKVFGLLCWIAIASPLTDRLTDLRIPQIGILLYAIPTMLIMFGYRLCQRRYQPRLASVDSKSILFLRPFDDDLVTSIQPRGLLAELTGLRMGYLSGLNGSHLMTQVMFNSYPTRLARMFLDYGTDSSEESLVRFFEEYGSVRAIGKPGDTFAVPGAARMELADDEWQQAVLEELNTAEAVVIQPGSTRGVHWELQQIRNQNKPRRVLLCLASFWQNPQGYEEMSRIVRETLLADLPRIVPFLDQPTFVYFDGDWGPRVQKLSYKCPLLWPVTADGTDLRYTLKPFVQGMQDRKILSPRAPRWTTGIRTGFSKSLAVVLSIVMAVLPVLAIELLFQLIGPSSSTVLKGRNMPYSLSIPASLLKQETPADKLEHHYMSPDGNLAVLAIVETTREDLSNLGELRIQANQATYLYSSIRHEATKMVDVAGEKWAETRLILKRKDNGVLIREKARAFSDDRGTIMILTMEVVDKNDSFEPITEKILASVKLDAPAGGDKIVGTWESVGSRIRIVQEFTRDGRSKISFSGTTTTGTYKLNGDYIDWSSDSMVGRHKVKVKFRSSTEMELSNDAGMVRYRKIGSPRLLPKELEAGKLNPQSGFSQANEAFDPVGMLPVGDDGNPLNFDFETGTLKDWTAEGEAFGVRPIKGDTVFARLRHANIKSQHQGQYWIGTFENAGDRPQGTLTSVPFKVTHRWATFLIGGGSVPSCCVELVREDTGEVFSRTTGFNTEAMRRMTVDLRLVYGKKIFIRLMDRDSGGWGHINFDDFRFHTREGD